MNKNNLIMLKDYGKIRLTLAEVMDERGITRNALARSIGTRFEVVDKWYRGDIEKLDLDILARICCVLECGTQDIISYEP